MASTTCGHCGRLAHMEAASGLHTVIARPGFAGGYREAAYECPNCGRLNLASEWDPDTTSNGVADSRIADSRHWERPVWLPLRGEVREFPDVPGHIAQAASEATLCHSVGAYRAVGALARAVIEATAKDKGAEGGNLAARIDALRHGDHIREHTKAQAHEVRHFGNDMAHGDFVDPVTQEEAEEVLELMAEVLDEVYQSPARLERRRQARLAKKGGAPT